MRMIEIARRYRIVVLAFILLMGGVLLPLQIGKSAKTTVVPPAQVIVTQARLIDQGVQIEWLAGQSGTHPVSGYTIERKRDGKTAKVAHIEKFSLNYIDTEGQAGDVYRVTAEDNQKPAKRSLASQPITASTAKPGSAVLSATAVQQPPDALAQATTADTRITVLRNAITQLFANFDSALTRKDIKTARQHLVNLDAYQKQALSLVPNLSVHEKTVLAAACAEHLNMFKANLLALPEQAHMEGMLVLAGCRALKESAQ